MSAKAWHGRFAEPPAKIAEAFTRCLPTDLPFAPHDIAGSRAHVAALVRAKLLTRREGVRLDRGLVRVGTELAERRFRFRATDEDVHMAVERRLTELVGTGRGQAAHGTVSRNDQVALDLRLWLRAECAAVDAALAGLQRALVRVARRYVGAVMPGYTHLQRGAADPARPPSPRLPRDARARPRPAARLPRPRRRDAARRRRPRRRRLPARPRVRRAPSSASRASTANSLDAVGDRDFVVEFARRGRDRRRCTSRGSPRRSCSGRPRSSASSSCPTRSPPAAR